MSLIPHWGDCERQIQKLRTELAESQAQNIAYMHDLNDLTCRLRMANLKKSDCDDCLQKTQETVVEKKETIVE